MSTMSVRRTRGSLKQLIAVVDFGDSGTKASTCECYANGDMQEFHHVTKWPGRTAASEYVPTVVAQSNEAFDGETRRSWGWEANNDISDYGSAFTKYDRIKSHMMDPSKTQNKDEVDSICLFYVSSLLEYLIAGRQSESLLIFVAVPVQVDLKFPLRLKMTNHYKDVFRHASPVEKTFIRVEDEPSAGRIGAKGLVAKILAEAGESVDAYDLISSVDFGSRTTDIGTSARWLNNGTVMDKFLWAGSLHCGSNEINKVIYDSNLSTQDKLTLEEKLESRKGNLQQWVESAPNGPAQLREPAGPTMKAMLVAELDLHKRVLKGVEDYLCSNVASWCGSGRKHLVILFGGGFGSQSFAKTAVERLENQAKYPGIKVVLTNDLKYSHQAVQVGMENIAKDPRLALTEPPPYDIFFDNHKGSNKTQVSRALRIWSRKSSFEEFFEMNTKSKPIVFEVEAKSRTKKTTEGLEFSCTVFVPWNAGDEIKTSQNAKDPAPVARSARKLKNTGEMKVILPTKSTLATVYVFYAILGRTAIIGVILNEKGTYVPELETNTVTAGDIFENGIFSGRLKQKYIALGLLYVEVDSALLPELEGHEKKKQGLLGTKRKRDDGETTVISSDDDEEECLGEDTGEAPRKLSLADKSAACNESDLVVPSASDGDGEERENARRYSKFIREAMDSAHVTKLTVCLRMIKPGRFSRAIAEEAGLLQTVKEVSDHEKEAVSKPCRSLLESWGSNLHCIDSGMQRVGDGEAHDGGETANQKSSSNILMDAVNGGSGVKDSC